MANIIPTRPRQLSQRRSFAIVSSQYNAPYVRGLVDFASRELDLLAPGADIEKHEVPGAFEIPIVVQEIAERGGVDAILALGVIIQGETQHADLIGQAVTQALLECGLRYRVPVVHEVLLVRDEEQARQRCLELDMNRGVEAARVAVRVLQTLNGLRTRGDHRHGQTP